MKENYIPHQNLEDPSNIIKNSKKSANNIFNNNNFEEIKQQIKNQNDYIIGLKYELEYSNNDINNNVNKIGSDTENIKYTIYQKLGIASNELSRANEQIKFLTQENIALKNIIENKDKIISDFEQLSLQTKDKFEKLEQINLNLKKQLQLVNSQGYRKTDDITDNTYNFNYNLNYENNNGIDNNELIYSLNNIKKDLELIETDYQIKLKEKDWYIEQINCELINVYREYVKLSDILEEMNYLVKNSDHNELKTEFNCLLREKEILLKKIIKKL